MIVTEICLQCLMRLSLLYFSTVSILNSPIDTAMQSSAINSALSVIDRAKIEQTLTKIGLEEDHIEDALGVLDDPDSVADRVQSLVLVVDYIDDFISNEDVHQLLGIVLSEEEKYILVLLGAKLVTIIPK